MVRRANRAFEFQLAGKACPFCIWLVSSAFGSPDLHLKKQLLADVVATLTFSLCYWRSYGDGVDRSFGYWRAGRELNPRIQVLQTRALATSPPAPCNKLISCCECLQVRSKAPKSSQE